MKIDRIAIAGVLLAAGCNLAANNNHPEKTGVPDTHALVLPSSPFPTETPKAPVAVSAGVETNPIVEVAAPAARQNTEVPPTPAPTDTPQPTDTLLPSPTRTNTVTSSPTPSAIPTATPEPMATPEEQKVDYKQAYPGVFPANNHRDFGDPFSQSIDTVITELPNAADFEVVDGFMDVLKNRRGPFNTNQTKTGGLEFQIEDFQFIKRMRTIDILQNADTITVSSLVHHNTATGLYTFGFRGKDYEKPATTYLAAMAIVFVQNGGYFADNETVAQAMADKKIEGLVTTEQNEITDETEDSPLGLSDEEKARRAIINNPLDANTFIPKENQGVDQKLTCDPYFVDVNGVEESQISNNARPQQIRQSVTGVIHRAGEINTIRHTDSEKGDVMIAGFYDATNKDSEVYAFISRGFVGNENSANIVFLDQMKSAVNAQEFPCAEIIPTSTPTATLAPNIPSQPDQSVTSTSVVGNTPENTPGGPTPMPTNIHDATATSGQPPTREATATDVAFTVKDGIFA